jgi:hypothetical protein
VVKRIKVLRSIGCEESCGICCSGDFDSSPINTPWLATKKGRATRHAHESYNSTFVLNRLYDVLNGAVCEDPAATRKLRRNCLKKSDIIPTLASWGLAWKNGKVEISGRTSSTSTRAEWWVAGRWRGCPPNFTKPVQSPARERRRASFNRSRRARRFTPSLSGPDTRSLLASGHPRALWQREASHDVAKGDASALLVAITSTARSGSPRRGATQKTS